MTNLQIVDPEAVKRKKRQPKPKAETPRQYLGSYATRAKDLDGNPYYCRAKDPGALFAKRIRKTMKTEPRELSDGTILRAVVVSTKNGGYYSPTFGAYWLSTESAENLPEYGDDLEALQEMINVQKQENTLKNTVARVKMLLAMLGNVEYEDSFSWYNVSRKSAEYLKVKDVTIGIFYTPVKDE